MAVYSAAYPIHTYETDANGRLTFAALFRYLQDIAADHAAIAGYGLEDLKRNASLWVLSRLRVRCYRMPRWRETLRIETWPSGSERIFALRDWDVRDSEGREVAIATSSWVVIDIEKRTPIRVERVADRATAIEDRRLFDRSPAKIPPFEAGAPDIETRATFADMDLNVHVNSTRYIEWMFDALPNGLRESGGEVAEIEVNFSGESHAGDEIAVHTLRDGDGFLQSVTKTNDGSVLCRARSRWRSRGD